MERRQSIRNQIEVDIEIAQPGTPRCFGIAENISRTGVSVRICKGELPKGQRSVILNFKVRTRNETLYRRIYARVARMGEQTMGLEFVEHDFIAEAIIQDLIYYLQRQRRKQVRPFTGRVETTRKAVAGAAPTGTPSVR